MTKWAQKKSPDYYGLILELCLALNAKAANQPELYNAMRDLAISVIDSPDEKPLEITGKLVLLLQGDREYSRGELKGEEWVKERKIRTRRLLKVWKSIQKQLAVLPEPAGPLYFRVSPPPETGLPDGVGPSAVKDPVLRKRFEEAIEKNKRNINAYQKKRDLADFEKRFAASAKRYLTVAYCKPPYQTDELEKSLEEFGVDKETRAAMGKEVQRRIAEKIARDAEMAKAIAARNAPKAPEPFVEPAVGTSVDAKLLSSDPKLQVPVIFKMTRPQLGELLDYLSSKTGYQITAGGNIPRDRVAYQGIHYHNVAAWTVMDQLNQAVTEKGHWVKEENGYKLVGDPKPPLKIQPATEDKPSPRPEGRKRSFISSPGFKILMFFGLLAATALFVYLHRRRMAKSAQPK